MRSRSYSNPSVLGPLRIGAFGACAVAHVVDADRAATVISQHREKPRSMISTPISKRVKGGASTRGKIKNTGFELNDLVVVAVGSAGDGADGITSIEKEPKVAARVRTSFADRVVYAIYVQMSSLEAQALPLHY